MTIFDHIMTSCLVPHFQFYFQDDDFEFVVEPGRPQKKYWAIAGVVLGILLILGSICIDNVVNVGILPSNRSSDQWESFIFMMSFCGGFLMVCSLFAYAYVSEIWCFKILRELRERNMQYPSLSSGNGNSTWIRYNEGLPLPLYDNRIPISEEVTKPQLERLKK